MKRSPENSPIAVIDVGTTKIVVLIAQQKNNGHLDLMGWAVEPSEGLSRGIVVDIPKTTEAIRLAVKEAELMAKTSINAVTVGVSGSHISSLDSWGIVKLGHEFITQKDIDSALEAARLTATIPEGKQILHCIPQYFVLNENEEKVQDPLGMFGVTLSVKAHLVLGAVSSIQNVVTCCESAGIVVRDVVLEQIASAEAVLTDDERSLGVGLLDIGGGTSDFVIYQGNSIRHTKVFPVAGNHFTRDLAIGLQLSLVQAERIKHDYGTVHVFDQHSQAYQADTLIGELEKRRSAIDAEVVRILRPRADELLSMIKHEIDTSTLRPLMPMGLVLTGGGSLLHGLSERASEVLEIPTRIGYPRMTQESSFENLRKPSSATAYGLLLYEWRKQKEYALHKQRKFYAYRVFEDIREWLGNLFC